MKKRVLSGLSALALSVVLLSSCGSVPQVEIDAAKAAIEEVKVIGAEVYSPENFVMLNDSLSAVMVGIEAENSKFFKNFSTSVASLQGVVTFASEIKAKTEAAKEAVKAEAVAVVAEVNALVEANNKLVIEAPVGKEGASAIEAIKTEISAISASLTEANAIIESGDYFSALNKAKASKEKANAINTELTTVIEKYKSNKSTKKGKK